ncbi:MAG: C10 family peptidase [Muribaculum sp.]|uniref:C10 family peptidase n=1 Tax=Candidatus Merdivivens faecigallinarum TaxID=2840871 RepID=A0A9D9NQK1_9BACT|nr:C10 family peptidase [Candidatus Merdivivens faecigallinarum]
MKRLFFILSMLSLFSCNEKINPNDSVYSRGADIKENDNVVTIEEALSNLNCIMSAISNDTRSFIGDKTVSYIDTLKLANLNNCMSATKSGESFSNLLYLANFNEGGYALLGADKRIDPIIAIVKEGTIAATDFNVSDTTSHTFSINQLYCEEDGDYYIGNSGNFSPLSFVKSYLSKIVSNPITASEDEEFLYYCIVDDPTAIMPMMITRWDQKRPFNHLCTYPGDYRPAGCGTIAGAQVLAYTKTASLSTHFEIDDMTWNELEIPYYYDYKTKNDRDINGGDYYSLNDYVNNYTDYMLREEYISKVVRTMAVNIGAKFNFFGSGQTFMTPQQLCNYMKSIGYSQANKKIGYSETPIINMLEAGKPVIISALENFSEGHFWVIDGMQYVYKKNVNTGEIQNLLMVNCNWGWRGECDGFYLSGIFDTRSGSLTKSDKYPGGFYADFWFRIITY